MITISISYYPHYMVTYYPQISTYGLKIIIYYYYYHDFILLHITTIFGE